MTSELLIYKQFIVDTYLHFIKQNIILIKQLLEEGEKWNRAYNSSRKEIYFTARAIHLQIMSIIGTTAEHLIKIILLKRGYILNEGCCDLKFNDELMEQLKKANTDELISEDEKQKLYEKGAGSIKVTFSDRLIKFNKCIELFKKSNPPDYHSQIENYNLNDDRIKYKTDYLGYSEITPENCLDVLQKVRNNYIHKATAHDEQNGIIWYLLNYIIWLAKKEYLDYFKDEEYIGNDKSKKLFK